MLKGIKIVGGSHFGKGSIRRNSGFVCMREFVRFNENLTNVGIDPVLVGCPGNERDTCEQEIERVTMESVL